MLLVCIASKLSHLSPTTPIWSWKRHLIKCNWRFECKWSLAGGSLHIGLGNKHPSEMHIFFVSLSVSFFTLSASIHFNLFERLCTTLFKLRKFSSIVVVYSWCVFLRHCGDFMFIHTFNDNNNNQHESIVWHSMT